MKNLQTTLRGIDLLEEPLLNKECAFSAEERSALGLHGLLPPRHEALEVQCERAYGALQEKTTPLERHIFLRSLQDRNETLFYALIERHVEEILPLIYTPIVGEACQNFHKIYRRARGLFLAYPDRHRMEEMLRNRKMEQVRLIVVSDGERILGLGDQGIGGMGISIGKCSLYTVCGGIHPRHCLPVILDVGTANEERLRDPLYFGWPHPRISEAEYEEFIELFVQALRKHSPNVLLQWEDFAAHHATSLLTRYQDQICSFNDDIQGTSAVTLAGILSALRVQRAHLKEQQIVIFGAGSAGTGVADLIVKAMQREGLSEKEALSRLWLVRSHGLLIEGQEGILPFQAPYAKPAELLQRWKVSNRSRISFKEVICNVHPTVLIGLSGARGTFTQEIVEEMAAFCKEPIIFPLSNPSSQSEADPADLIQWTVGKAWIATGTKFPDVAYREHIYRIGQCNNYFIFPAIGLAVLATGARRITTEMFLAAAYALAALCPAKSSKDALFASPSEIRRVTEEVAFGIGQVAAPHLSEEELRRRIQEQAWRPVYPEIAPHG